MTENQDKKEFNPSLPGIITFFVGVLVAAGAGAKLPAKAVVDSGAPASAWPDTLPIFVLGVLIAVVGQFMWRKTLKATIQAENQKEGEGSDKDPFVLLASAMGPLEKLERDIHGLKSAQICERVDEILDKYVHPFVEVRQKLINRLGMDAGAEILVTVAYGERMLNRVWSAASDNHRPEACTVLPDAVDAFEEAEVLIKKATKTN